MTEFYRRLKESVFQELQTDQGIRIRDLPGSGQAIVTGAPLKLEKLVRAGGVLERNQEVRVLPNVMFDALPPGLTATESPDANVEFPPASHLPGDNEP